jgi:SAM-dependent methyltransferase
MNRLENWFCASSLWRFITRKQLLPWLVAGSSLGDHVLEVGAGFGAATAELRRLTTRVTSLEYDPRSVIACAARQGCPGARVVRGDAAALPFRDHLFSAVFAVLVLHHLLSPGLQDRAFAEIFRVLRPGGVFLALEISGGWLHRAAHIRSTFVPVAPHGAITRLKTAGFSQVTLDYRGSSFRLRALRPLENGAIGSV